MRRWLWSCCWVIAIAAIGALVFETRRLAELAGQYEVQAREARKAAEAGASAGQAANAPAAAADTTAQAATVARLEAALASSQQQLQTMSQALETRTAEIAMAAADAEEAARLAQAPMPEGVRLCLQALHECLRVEGFTNQRFLSARSLDGEGLHDVELIEVDADGLGATFLHAGRMTAELDRGKGRFVLTFFDGFRTVAGERQKLSADGWPLLFAPVDGRLIEQRLPYLVRVVGVYPDPEGAAERRLTDVDAITRRQWLERLDRLLDAAHTPHHLRVNRFRGMHDGYFLTAEVVGTDDRFRLLASAHCEKLAVEIDQAAGIVSLLLKNGVLRSGGVESTITAEGFRMLLGNVTPKQASDTMFGMVVSK
jgi:Sec-independent protein translocase protein TatA